MIIFVGVSKSLVTHHEENEWALGVLVDMGGQNESASHGILGLGPSR